MNKKLKLIASTIILILIIGGAGLTGYFWGQQQGGKEKTQEQSQAQIQNLKALVNTVFPPPSEEIYSLSGTIKDIYGATIHLEIDDPNDYLPHLDGSPRRKEIRFANVSSKTTYTLIDFTRFDQKGNPLRTSFQFSDLKKGDVITVRSNQNIKTAKQFDVAAIEIVKP